MKKISKSKRFFFLLDRGNVLHGRYEGSHRVSRSGRRQSCAKVRLLESCRAYDYQRCVYFKAQVGDVVNMRSTSVWRTVAKKIGAASRRGRVIVRVTCNGIVETAPRKFLADLTIHIKKE